MAKTKIKMNAQPLPIESTISLSVLDFVKLHDTFVNQKRLEGLAQRTLSDYVTHMNYLNRWLEAEQRLVGNWRKPVCFHWRKMVWFSLPFTGRLDSLIAIKNFRKYAKKSGLNKRCTPHIWRHTFAVNAVKANIDVFTLQRILGHASLSTTRLYVQLDDEFITAKHSEAGVLNRFL